MKKRTAWKAFLNCAGEGKMQLRIKESIIEKSILHWLLIKGIFAWKAKTMGTYDPTRQRFRKNPEMMSGVSDILGIYKGYPLAIEVKRPYPKTYPSKDQKEFLEKFRQAGGIALVARSIEDVERGLKELCPKINTKMGAGS